MESGMSKKEKTTVVQKSLIRSSAAEYLTFVAAAGQGGVEAVYADENVWLTQKMMGLLYDVDVRTINYHLQKVFSDTELEADSVIQNFRITAADGKSYDTKHYNLAAIIAVGYKVNSERKFYQKITDIYATSIDYDVTAQATKRCFATVQNKLHWAIHGQTAAEVIVHRADATKNNMGLIGWKDAQRLVSASNEIPQDQA
ncbi:MAG: hypothetical protein RIR18_989 [Pseudomonadota bacterium]|jgi:hypothetical protein